MNQTQVQPPKVNELRGGEVFKKTPDEKAEIKKAKSEWKKSQKTKALA